VRRTPKAADVLLRASGGRNEPGCTLLNSRGATDPTAPSRSRFRPPRRAGRYRRFATANSGPALQGGTGVSPVVPGRSSWTGPLAVVQSSSFAFLGQRGAGRYALAKQSFALLRMQAAAGKAELCPTAHGGRRQRARKAELCPTTCATRRTPATAGWSLQAIRYRELRSGATGWHRRLASGSEAVVLDRSPRSSAKLQLCIPRPARRRPLRAGKAELCPTTYAGRRRQSRALRYCTWRPPAARWQSRALPYYICKPPSTESTWPVT
jgi:hypothetical protein